MQKFIHYIWYHPNLIKYLLWPVSLLYRFIIAIRHLFYLTGIFKAHRIAVPVVIVGNVTVGGTGKTPLVIALVNTLKNKGFRPGVITRGYRGKATTWPQVVTETSHATLVGDEAMLLAEHTHVPVIAGPNRVRSAHQLVQDFGCDVIVSDDGLQHYALQRDIEIAVVDSMRRNGNGFCLPAGPLREPQKRFRSVDFIVANGLSRVGEYNMQFCLDEIVSLKDEKLRYRFDDFKHKTIVAIAGIGNPDRFFESLRTQQVTFSTRVFSDHHHFTKEDIDVTADAVVLMTEKDAVKCRDISDERHFYVRGHAVVAEKLFEDVVGRLKNVGSEQERYRMRF